MNGHIIWTTPIPVEKKLSIIICVWLAIIYLKSNRESMIMMMTIYVKCQIAAGIVERGM